MPTVCTKCFCPFKGRASWDNIHCDKLRTNQSQKHFIRQIHWMYTEMFFGRQWCRDIWAIYTVRQALGQPIDYIYGSVSILLVLCTSMFIMWHTASKSDSHCHYRCTVQCFCHVWCICSTADLPSYIECKGNVKNRIVLLAEGLIKKRPVYIWVVAHVGNSSCKSPNTSVVLLDRGRRTSFFCSYEREILGNRMFNVFDGLWDFQK